MPDRKQTIRMGTLYGNGWTETEVRTMEAWDESLIASKVSIRSKNDAKFVDLFLEEYTGESRRAKLTTVRLEEPAGRALYAQLKKLYG